MLQHLAVDPGGGVLAAQGQAVQLNTGRRRADAVGVV